MYLNHVSIIGFVGNDARLKSTMHGREPRAGARPAVHRVQATSTWTHRTGAAAVIAFLDAQQRGG